MQGDVLTGDEIMLMAGLQPHMVREILSIPVEKYTGEFATVRGVPVNRYTRFEWEARDGVRNPLATDAFAPVGNRNGAGVRERSGGARRVRKILRNLRNRGNNLLPTNRISWRRRLGRGGAEYDGSAGATSTTEGAAGAESAAGWEAEAATAAAAVEGLALNAADEPRRGASTSAPADVADAHDDVADAHDDVAETGSIAISGQDSDDCASEGGSAHDFGF
eukprot:3935538-Rhodomonas_salina.2